MNNTMILKVKQRDGIQPSLIIIYICAFPPGTGMEVLLWVCVSKYLKNKIYDSSPGWYLRMQLV